MIIREKSCEFPCFSAGRVCLWLKISVSVSGHGGERVPREGPAGGVPHQGQPRPGGVPAGDGASQREPHRRAGGRLAQPLQEVSTQPGEVIHPLWSLHLSEDADMQLCLCWLKMTFLSPLLGVVLFLCMQMIKLSLYQPINANVTIVTLQNLQTLLVCFDRY